MYAAQHSRGQDYEICAKQLGCLGCSLSESLHVAEAMIWQILVLLVVAARSFACSYTK